MKFKSQKPKEILISKLKPAPYNPRTLSKKQFSDLKVSIEKFGIPQPAVINTYEGREMVIIGGHQRIKVAASLGYKTFPCVMMCLSLNQEQELNARFNKNGGSWDWDKLANEYEIDTLIYWGFEPKDFEGFGGDSPDSEGEKCEACGQKLKKKGK